MDSRSYEKEGTGFLSGVNADMIALPSNQGTRRFLPAGARVNGIKAGISAFIILRHPSQCLV